MTGLAAAIIPAALDGERVDRAVALLFGLSRSEVAGMVAREAVRVEGRAVKVRSQRLVAGETVEVMVTPPEGVSGLEPDASVEVPVVYADDAVIVVDKPAGLVVHPGAGQSSGTMVHGLLAQFPDLANVALMGGGMDLRPGIVHRLDKGTSGLLVVARTAAARASLVEQLATRRASRHYTALAWGAVEAEAGLIDAPIKRADADPTRMAVRAGGREARTRYRVTGRFHVPVEVTSLDCQLETGRTHQIRVHLAAIGHPVAGDPRYGSRRWLEGVPALSAGRVFLHAHHLAFDHPATGKRVTFDSPLPADLSAVLSGLG
ncbi:MAG TPA: RluA family pseudouridine synthase [Acidimicrobiales bacterium]